jgi:DNA topoisomerase-3
MRLFIAEKPSQGRDIAKILGCHQRSDGYLSNGHDSVTWGIGHLLQPAEPDAYGEQYKKWDLANLPIIPDEFKEVPNPKTKSQLKVVKALLKMADEVVLATDADREGELIGRLILKHAQYRGPLKRLWLSALDDASIKKALNNLKDGRETKALYWAGLGRQRADWMTGMSYTRASSIVFGGPGNVFSVGRVQTPTLRLIVERDLEIENFVAKPFYTIVADFSQDNANVTCHWVVPDEAKGDEEGRCLDRKIAEHVEHKCAGKDGKIITYETKRKSQHAPLPFSLSELQKSANNQYGYDAKTVLKVAQSLYETHKATTYPRSDCNYLNLSQFDEAAQILAHLQVLNQDYKPLIDACDTHFKSRCWNDKKVSESSHHAIIPTNNSKVDISKMSDAEKNIYDLIVRQYIAQFMGQYVYDETVLEIICEGERFKTKGIIPVELAWKKALAKNSHTSEDEGKKNQKSSQETQQQLPVLNPDESVHCDKLTIKDKMTSPPQHYTDATLIAAMKNCGRKLEDAAAKKMLSEVQGIGTEATRADIIETLKARSYITNNKKYLISTDKGRQIIKLLPDQLSSVEITANWEEKLNHVAKGQASYEEFISGITQSLSDNIGLIKGMNGNVSKNIANPCPKCGSELIRQKSKKGSGFWWGCSNWKGGCTCKMDDKNGKPIAKVAPVTSDIDCPTCKTHKLVKRSSKKSRKTNVFWACSGFPECRAIFFDDNGKPQLEKKEAEKTGEQCPQCEADLVKRHGKKGDFIGCSAYPKCKYIQ